MRLVTRTPSPVGTANKGRAVPVKNRRNYYRILHVQPDAPVEIIKASYKTLMQKLGQHPDLGGGHENAALINEAYAVVTDPVRREAYDRELRAAKRGYTHGGHASPSSTCCVFCGAPHPFEQVGDPELVCTQCEAPLSPATRPRLEQEQRAVARMPRRQAIRYFTKWPQRTGFKGWTLDVSLNGMKFVAQRPLQPQTLVKIDSDLCGAVGVVVNCLMDRRVLGVTWQIGIQFETVRFQKTNGSFVSAQA